MWQSFLSTLPFAAAQLEFSLTNWHGVFNQDSGVLQSLKAASFDFSPADFFDQRNSVGQYHTGDITLRWRVEGQNEWSEIDTAIKRNSKPRSFTDVTGVLLRSTFDDVFPDAEMLGITRDWTTDDGDLILKATITNKGNDTLEIGAFGFPLEFNSIFTTRKDITAECVLIDPYIGLDAGYVQVTRLTGTGPNLVITPYGNSSKFEAWRFLTEDDVGKPFYYQSQTFEGFYAWQTLSKAYAENEWNSTEPWNVPTSVMLQAGENITFGLKFGVAGQIHEIEDAVAANNVPIAVGLPGYVLPCDTNGKLFLRSSAAVEAITIVPSDTLTLTEAKAKNSAWVAYDVTPAQGSFGRARVTISYQDGRTQTVHYFLTDTQRDTATNYAEFLFNQQYYTDTTDVFRRAPSVITYDYEERSQLLQSQSTWFAGLSDEAGAGSYLAAAMKTSAHPIPEQVQKLEEIVKTVIWGWLQNSEGDTKNATNLSYGVKKSLFYYDPEALPDFPYDKSIEWAPPFPSWSKKEADSFTRAYDYVHVSALYWALYTAERVSPGVLHLQNSTWYLNQACETIIATKATDVNGNDIVGYAFAGLMGETVWLEILKALKEEKMMDQVARVEEFMGERQEYWASLDQPYGSEMAWDSTGQEGVYQWSKYFGNDTVVEKTLASIRGYMPTVAHWAWNGNARRYWDFIYAGKLQRIERMVHHYGSGLNAIPLLDSYKYNKSPTSASAFHDLRVGYGGTMGATTNVNAEGFASVAFHSFPDTMKWDAYSGDSGVSYSGHVLASRTFLVDHSDYGWVCFGGNVEESYDGKIHVRPLDTVQRRIYVASMGLAVEFDAGVISSFEYDPATRSVKIDLVRVEGQNGVVATMTWEDTLGSGVKLVTQGLKERLGGLAVAIPGEVEFAI
ncbi:hypothetical protein TI39_contig401g00004 [Zymoseptoria brevis]|uniref:Glycoside hydrolase family 43 protein n=1 Tax=Zymoseptoria brevis TaxID=1047168 RepID=A0A0F4GNI4_9PEZI|nr:hypothetical protein TI39_contig401g00004 [Zymoseptoria brevis]